MRHASHATSRVARSQARGCTTVVVSLFILHLSLPRISFRHECFQMRYRSRNGKLLPLHTSCYACGRAHRFKPSNMQTRKPSNLALSSPGSSCGLSPSVLPEYQFLVYRLTSPPRIPIHSFNPSPTHLTYPPRIPSRRPRVPFIPYRCLPRPLRV